MTLIEKGQRVECIKRDCPHFGKKGSFNGYFANALKVKFDDGSEAYYLADEIRKIND